MLTQIITKVTKNQFARALKFEEGITPSLPFCNDDKKRLLYIHIPFCEELCPYCSFHRVRLPFAFIAFNDSALASLKDFIASPFLVKY